MAPRSSALKKRNTSRLELGPDRLDRVRSNLAARIAGSSVSLNLSHAFEAAMAGYGLGRILNSRDSSEGERAATPLAQNLEAGEKAAANSQAPTMKLQALQTSPNGNRNAAAPSHSNSTMAGDRVAPTAPVARAGSNSTQHY